MEIEQKSIRVAATNYIPHSEWHKIGLISSVLAKFSQSPPRMASKLSSRVLLLICFLATLSQYSAHEPNETATTTAHGEELVHRIKRFLIFNNGGLVKVLPSSRLHNYYIVTLKLICAVNLSPRMCWAS